jgi:sulfatase modifying factor 1
MLLTLLGAAQAAPSFSCPPDMAFIADEQLNFCIDRFEAHLRGWEPTRVPGDGLVAASEPGVLPQAYISAEVAADACENAGKRLCDSEEWVRACVGSTGTRYPYGDHYQPGACNEGRERHPVIQLFGAATNWLSAQMNDPRLNLLDGGLDLAGANERCVSEDGVFDLHGNLHEWVADPAGTFRGGYYVDAVRNGEGCRYRTTAHETDYHDYSTGFRCCADPAE